MQNNTGTLYIIATPIGNLEDITYRAVRILGEVDLIAAEDTRHSLKLLNHFNISKPLTSYFDHNQRLKGERILETLRKGNSVALISDAGTPCVSDPGYHLVRDATAEGIKVVPVPGPSASLTALSASGLPSDMFTFAGFAPARQGRRKTFLKDIMHLAGTVILYEAPHRLIDCLNDMREILGERQIVVARELTKIYEEFVRGNISEVLATIPDSKVRGEVVILISPDKELKEDNEPVDELLKRFLFEEGLSIKDAAKKIAEISGISKSEAYTEALRLRNGAEIT